MIAKWKTLAYFSSILRLQILNVSMYVQVSLLHLKSLPNIHASMFSHFSLVYLWIFTFYSILLFKNFITNTIYFDHSNPLFPLQFLCWASSTCPIPNFTSSLFFTQSQWVYLVPQPVLPGCVWSFHCTTSTLYTVLLVTTSGATNYL